MRSGQLGAGALGVGLAALICAARLASVAKALYARIAVELGLRLGHGQLGIGGVYHQQHVTGFDDLRPAPLPLHGTSHGRGDVLLPRRRKCCRFHEMHGMQTEVQVAPTAARMTTPSRARRVLRRRHEDIGGRGVWVSDMGFPGFGVFGAAAGAAGPGQVGAGGALTGR